MEEIIKPVLIALWLFGLLYFSFPKKDELIEKYELKFSDSKKSMDKNIKQYALFLIINAVLVMILGFYQFFYHPLSNIKVTGAVLFITGAFLFLASYGIWHKYSWSRYMTYLLLISITIIIIATTDPYNYDFSHLNPQSSTNIDLHPYYNLITWFDVAIYLMKIGYFTVLSLASLRFLEHPRIKAVISR
ncbi:MAG: hypothetical protein P1P80_02955 [ANME-2 cluster archaeon]|nr:hypothetical protein [ANME-2 cluster archaeon]